MTERLYYADSYRRDFTARVVGTRPHDAHVAVALDRTAFYPASGGQPHDSGTLNGTVVREVFEENDVIWHVLEAPVADQVTGEIDWPRRFDHMQQHTGQHILSQSCLRVLNGQTRAVHLGADRSTVDLDLAEFSAPEAERVEEQSNIVVLENRAVIIREVDDEALPTLGLRRPAAKRGRVRVIEIDGFDRSACGGTHVARTGEIGPIKIRRWERYKGGVRVDFLCGWRALRDYGWKHNLVADLAARFSVKDLEVGETIARLGEQLRDRDRQLAFFRDRLLDADAQRRLSGATGEPKVIAELVTDWPGDAVPLLAGRLTELATAVAILGLADGKLVIARSPQVNLDAGAVLRRIVEARGGRGGGRREFAQGALPPAFVTEAIEAARVEVTRLLTSQN